MLAATAIAIPDLRMLEVSPQLFTERRNCSKCWKSTEPQIKKKRKLLNGLRK
jgi:hypothetical protein